MPGLPIRCTIRAPFSASAVVLAMKRLFSLALVILLSGCSVGHLPGNLSRAMMNQDDPAIVEAGAPAYLLLLDAMILTYPDNEDFLLAGSRLYGAYAGVFARDQEQARRMADKAMNYARRALCEYDEDACTLIDGPQDRLLAGLQDNYDEDDIAMFYAKAAAWAGWIQANSDNWHAIAQLGKVKTLMQWVASLDPSFDNATVQVYLGVLESQLPPSLGGKPELAREYFERAIVMTNGHNLMAHVMFAKQYARLMFEQELHDRLLQEALAADPHYEGLTLINRLAQRQAAMLLAESSDYFE